ncbi:hypothetical protein CYQ88_06590 [Hydrogenovibrio sp. SC-1]|uniref:hypothetical protein n=1 Tax=Hydrogenovibrio sp. SC-1 TaxID=2065820 RepID=UPI000C7DB54E|nr:hypothetical protein [Hydrogenovibrio sp. SC-1]PLA74352.1 hypothetical protein CYQ88_06590 [Hydrogenovibrio sp. SC-1]
MFDLFKNSRLSYPLNWIVWGISVSGVLYWLFFAFIEKAFLDRVFGGTALFVDLLLGLPVVLIFALVVYALIYWGLKVLVILLLPNWFERIESTDTLLSDTLEEGDWVEPASPETDKETPTNPTASSSSKTHSKTDD